MAPRQAGYTDDLALETAVAEIFAADPTRTDADVAAEAVEPMADKHVNGFRRDEHGLFVEGRQLKAGIKEAASVARAAGKLPAKFGLTNKGILAYIAST